MILQGRELDDRFCKGGNWWSACDEAEAAYLPSSFFPCLWRSQSGSSAGAASGLSLQGRELVVSMGRARNGLSPLLLRMPLTESVRIKFWCSFMIDFSVLYNYRYFRFPLPFKFFEMLKNYRNLLITVREKKFRRPNGNFWVQCKTFHL